MDYRVIEVTDPEDPLIDDLYELCVQIDGPDTRCAPGATYPERDMMRHAAQSGDGLRLYAVLDVAFDDEPVGMVIVGPDGQFQWLKSELEIIGPVTLAAGEYITNVLGTRAWGIMRNPEIRQRIADAGAAVDHDEERVWWGG